MDRPWWRRIDGLPRSVERRRREALSDVMVTANRVGLAFLAVAVMLCVAIGQWEGAALLGATALFSWTVSPAHHRRQILGRA